MLLENNWFWETAHDKGNFIIQSGKQHEICGMTLSADIFENKNI